MKKNYILIFTILLTITGCVSDNIDFSKTELEANKYLENKGYIPLKIISDGETNDTSYTLTRDKLIKLPYMKYWALQDVNPLDYLGKKIYMEHYIVKNHPLDFYETSKYKGKGETKVWVYIVDGKAIGGTSLPILEEQLDGGIWNIDGKTLKEVQEYDDYQKWRKKWVNQFSLTDY